jgi:hypothetical protein
MEACFAAIRIIYPHDSFSLLVTKSCRTNPVADMSKNDAARAQIVDSPQHILTNFHLLVTNQSLSRQGLIKKSFTNGLTFVNLLIRNFDFKNTDFDNWL